MLRNQRIGFVSWKNIYSQKYVEYFNGSKKLGTQLNSALQALQREYAKNNKISLNSITIKIPENLIKDIEKVVNTIGVGYIIIDKNGEFKVFENYNPWLHLKKFFKPKVEFSIFVILHSVNKQKVYKIKSKKR